jgi:hypothetical protein
MIIFGYLIPLYNTTKFDGQWRFNTFSISNNNSNGDKESICTYLANSCNVIRPDDLFVGKIIDNGILLARMILLQQNQLCNGHILTRFESLVVFLLIAIALGITERNHPLLLASTLVAGGSVSWQANIAILLLFECP